MIKSWRSRHPRPHEGARCSPCSAYMPEQTNGRFWKAKQTSVAYMPARQAEAQRQDRGLLLPCKRWGGSDRLARSCVQEEPVNYLIPLCDRCICIDRD